MLCGFLGLSWNVGFYNSQAGTLQPNMTYCDLSARLPVPFEVCSLCKQRARSCWKWFSAVDERLFCRNLLLCSCRYKLLSSCLCLYKLLAVAVWAGSLSSNSVSQIPDFFLSFKVYVDLSAPARRVLLSNYSMLALFSVFTIFFSCHRCDVWLAPFSALIQHGEGRELPVPTKLSSTSACPTFLPVKLRSEPLCCLRKEDGFEL